VKVDHFQYKDYKQICIYLRLLIHDLDSHTYCSLDPHVSFLLFVLLKISNPTNILNGTKVCKKNATTDVFIFQKINQRCLAVQHPNRSKYYHLTFLPSLPPTIASLPTFAEGEGGAEGGNPS